MDSEKDDSKRSRRDKVKRRDGERHNDHKSRPSDREKIVVEEDKHYKEHKEKKHRDREREGDRKKSHDDDKEIKDRAKIKARSEDSDVEREERQRKRYRHRKRGREDDPIEESSEDRELEEMESDRHRKRGREDDKKSAEKKIKDANKDKDVERVDGEDRERDKEIIKKAKEREREDREREKTKEREREDREREKAKEREREDKEREKVKEQEEKERERVKKREREDRERERAKEKAREREREKEKDREKYREREKKERREEEKEKERTREREKNTKVERGSDENEDDRKHDRKRHRRGDDFTERDNERTGRSRRHRDSNEGNLGIKSEVDTAKKEKETTREEDLEEEQRRLDEDADKRRRRVQEWQELKRKKEESEIEINGDATTDLPKSSKTWTLEGESDDEEIPSMEKSDEDMNVGEDAQPTGENGDSMAVDFEKETDAPLLQNGCGGDIVDEEEIDPLDAFMNSMVLPEVENLNKSEILLINSGNSMEPEKKDKLNGEQGKKGSSKSIGRIIPGEDSDSDFGELEKDEDTVEDENDDDFMKRVKKTQVEKLSLVDHTKIEYKLFRKNFYIEVKEISRMTAEEVAAYRKELELKIHGKDVPKPIKTWHQIGLTTRILELIKKLNFEKPMPIQAQTLPVIMSGRDCIGVAKTGSGKTLAFVLPMLRHIKDQLPVAAGDGPIGLIMAPTRELVQQIHSDIKKFAKLINVRCVPVYGGSGVAQQISELKRGTEIVVCTPGRMIDILCTSGGKITNLRRVTFFVMDEADRMFDMGFEPQITRIVQNTRPDRQTVLFSATFPRQVEILARKVLNKPVEIQVGGRSVVNKDIDQLVEVRPESDRFLRLLELLGEWCDKGKVLIFVQSQEKCDSLFKDLIRHGYPCLSLHGAKDQTDRESTISDFKTNVCNLLIATSIAARGLDVKELELVINYDVPNHYEDYVHRVGRTGRAGRKGCAITFISEDDARYAPDLVKALELCEQSVPDDLKALADGFMAKVKQGLEQAHGTGYGGSGFKFNEEEDEVRKAAKKAQAKEYGFEEDKSDTEDEDDGVRKAGGGDISQQAALAQFAALAAASKTAHTVVSAAQPVLNGGVPLSLPGVPGLLIPGVAAVPVVPTDGAARAAAFAAAMNLQHNLAKIQADAMPEHYEAELEINDFPQNARWKVTHKETLGPISEWTGAAITTRGQFYPPGKIAAQGERKLYLFIEGPTEQSVKRAKAELKRVLEDVTSHVSSLPGGAQPGRYNVL